MSAAHPTPNLEGQLSLFISPGERVAQLYPRALGAHFSCLLRHAWATVGLFLPSHHAGKQTSITRIVMKREKWSCHGASKRRFYCLILQPLHRLSHSSFSNTSAALPISQLILQSFCCFTYVIGTSPTSQLIIQPFRRFIYDTDHSTTHPPLHLRHWSFNNPSVASPMSKALHVLHLASRPCIEG